MASPAGFQHLGGCIEPRMNTVLLSNLPPHATVPDLLDRLTICGPFGRLYSAEIFKCYNSQWDGGPSEELKARVAFFTTESSQLLLSHVDGPGIVFDKYIMEAEWSPVHVKETDGPDDPDASRVVVITGPTSVVNKRDVVFTKLSKALGEKAEFQLVMSRERGSEWDLFLVLTSYSAAKKAIHLIKQNCKHGVSASYGRDPMETRVKFELRGRNRTILSIEPSDLTYPEAQSSTPRAPGTSTNSSSRRTHASNDSREKKKALKRAATKFPNTVHDSEDEEEEQEAKEVTPSSSRTRSSGSRPSASSTVYEEPVVKFAFGDTTTDTESDTNAPSSAADTSSNNSEPATRYTIEITRPTRSRGAHTTRTRSSRTPGPRSPSITPPPRPRAPRTTRPVAASGSSGTAAPRARSITPPLRPRAARTTRVYEDKTRQRLYERRLAQWKDPEPLCCSIM
ncbi:hypothetical protein V8F20_003431 [Naviculisporaceae sp. PSN 640]